MNNEHKLRQLQEVLRGRARIKTLDLRLNIGNCDLTKEIKRAFDLAKSSGQELDLTFSCRAR